MKRVSILMAVAAVGLVGCGKSVEDNCKMFCEKSAECNPNDADATPAGIAQCTSECKADIEAGNDDCQDAFGEFADCVDGASCTALETECMSEGFTFVGQCEAVLN